MKFEDILMIIKILVIAGFGIIIILQDSMISKIKSLIIADWKVISELQEQNKSLRAENNKMQEQLKKLMLKQDNFENKINH